MSECAASERIASEPEASPTTALAAVSPAETATEPSATRSFTSCIGRLPPGRGSGVGRGGQSGRSGLEPKSRISTKNDSFINGLDKFFRFLPIPLLPVLMMIYPEQLLGREATNNSELSHVLRAACRAISYASGVRLKLLPLEVTFFAWPAYRDLIDNVTPVRAPLRPVVSHADSAPAGRRPEFATA